MEPTDEEVREILLKELAGKDKQLEAALRHIGIFEKKEYDANI